MIYGSPNFIFILYQFLFQELTSMQTKAKTKLCLINLMNKHLKTVHKEQIIL